MRLEGHKWVVLYVWWVFKNWRTYVAGIGKSLCFEFAFECDALVFADQDLINYLACFHLKSLCWHPIRIAGTIPCHYPTPLRFQMTDDNTLVASECREHDGQNIARYISIPFG